jgi:predicted Fe-Mo cluster-binding NifX family protein
MQSIFGRCEYFFFVDPESMEFEVAPNPYASASDESGIQSAKMVIEKGATTVLTAQVGTKARQVLDAAGVKVMDMEEESVRKTVEAFRKRRSNLDVD